MRTQLLTVAEAQASTLKQTVASSGIVSSPVDAVLAVHTDVVERTAPWSSGGVALTKSPVVTPPEPADEAAVAAPGEPASQMTPEDATAVGKTSDEAAPAAESSGCSVM